MAGAKKARAFKFTAFAIEKLKPPASGRLDYSNTAVPGMQLRVSAPQPGRRPNKVYRVKARIRGKQVPMTIGNAAVLSLAEASKRAREFLAEAAAGRNPVEDRRHKEAAEKAVVTVQVVFARYLNEYARAKMRPDYFKETDRALQVDAMSVIGAMPIDQLTKQKIRSDVLGPIIARGRQPHAAHVLRYLRAFLTWAVKEDIIAANPAVDIPDPDIRKQEDRERDRYLDDAEIPIFWTACNAVGHTFGPLFKLLLLTGARRDELADATWREFDLDRRLWTLPGRRAKNGNDHLTHLSDLALEILKGLPRPRRDDPNEFLFSTTGRTPSSGFYHALKRVIAVMSEAAGRPVAHFTIHDMRRSIATGMAELGVSEHVVDRVLNHSGRKVSGVARIYNRSEYLPARQAALELWSQHVKGLIHPDKVGAPKKVVPIRAAV